VKAPGIAGWPVQLGYRLLIKGLLPIEWVILTDLAMVAELSARGEAIRPGQGGALA